MKKFQFSISVFMLVLMIISIPLYFLPNHSYADGPYSVSGVLWWDQNGGDSCGGVHDGLRQPGEVMLNGVKVELYVLQKPGSFFEGQYRPVSPPIVTWTDANGNYKFDNVPAEDYKVVFHDPGQRVINGYSINDYAMTTPNVNNNNNDDIDSDITTGFGTNNFMTTNFILGDQNPNQKIDGGLIGVCPMNPTDGEVDISVKKIWDDNNDEDNIRPDSVEIEVSSSVDSQTFILNEGNNWEKSGTIWVSDTNDFSLNCNENNVPNGYVVSYSDNVTDFTVTNTHTPVPKYKIGDYVWYDTNKNGIQDDGVAGVAGVKVTLTKPDGTTKETTTDADGKYVFEGLVNGDYKVVFSDLPEDYEATVTGAGTDASLDSNGLSAEVTIADADDMTVALGLVKKEVPPAPTYKIGDYVWYDTNKNGIQDDGMAGVAGVKVTLTKPDGTTKETTTDADGKYVFEGLVNGDYKVAFSDLPEDYEATVTGAGTDASLDSNGLSAEVTIADADDMTIALGLVKKEVPPAPTYKIGDYVWYDTNKNGIQDDGVAGVAGVKVTLTKPDGTTKETITDADGKYVFEGLVNGDYKVAFSDLPEDYEATVTGAGTDASLDSNGLSAEVTIADADDMTVALGLVKKEVPPAPTYKIGDYVWYDTNKNGIQDDGDSGVKGVKVTLTKPDGTTKETITDADGKYVFEGLVNGDYKVAFSNLPEDYEATVTGAGTDASLDSNGLSAEVTIADADDMTIALGLVKKEVPPAPTYKIGGYVWNDADKDGIQSLDEKGVEGIKVTLTMPNGNMKTVTTDADGKYVFEGLVNGDYKVTFSDLPEGYVPTLTGQGTSSELDSNGLNSDITIKDADNMTIDLGIVYDAQLPSTGMSQGIGYILFSLLIISIGMTLISRDRISVK